MFLFEVKVLIWSALEIEFFELYFLQPVLLLLFLFIYFFSQLYWVLLSWYTIWIYNTTHTHKKKKKKKEKKKAKTQKG